MEHLVPAVSLQKAAFATAAIHTHTIHAQELTLQHPMHASGPPPAVIEAHLRFKRPPCNPVNREPSLSASTEEGFGATEMAASTDRRSMLASRSRQQELNNIAHPNLDPTLTTRMEEVTLLPRTLRSDGPYSRKLKKKKRGWWYIQGQEPRRDGGQKQR